VHITAQIVHDHFGTPGGERQRVLLAQAAACASDDGHTAFEIDAHENFPCEMLGFNR
jgi:hypothetical protein